MSHSGDSPVILDAGCGEGTYTAGIYQALTAAGKTPRMAGVDISKFILRYAAKREKAIEFAVASSYHLPVAEDSVDILLNCFSPLALEEFRRVLRPGGWFFYVVPAADHLWELKQVLYDTPYPNEEKETPYEGFRYEAIVPVEDTITLTCQADIHALFQMTPYYWKTPKAGAERLAALDTLTSRIAFHVHIFQRVR
jgi:23S rRNA (guanine745-N1)-methyltransferase